MTDNYLGESLGKKIARAQHWEMVRSYLGPRFYEKSHVVIASREGGDISTLKGYGVSPDKIIAVDICPEAIEKCRFIHPDVTIENIDVVKRVKRTPLSIASVFLDLCNNLNSEDLILDMMDDISSVLNNKSILSLNILRAREINLQFKETKNLFEEMDLIYKDLGIARVDNNGIDDSRILYIWKQLRTRVLHKNIAPTFLECINYHSRTESSAGSPMTTGIFCLFKKPHSMTKDDFSRGSLSFQISYSRSQKNNLWQFDNVTLDTLKRQSLIFLEHGYSTDSISKILNLPTQQVRAWKAHQTIGTYSNALL